MILKVKTMVSLLKNPTLVWLLVASACSSPGSIEATDTFQTLIDTNTPNTETDTTKATDTPFIEVDVAPGEELVTITGVIYADNYFEFFVNGELIAVDPVDFTPHQAVGVSFQVPLGTTPTYAILASDFATNSGYEYTMTNNPQLGDGGLIASFSDGTVTGDSWKCFTVLYGPTEASEQAGCDKNNLDLCLITDSGMPANWAAVGYDDSTWAQATEHTAADVGWGRTPTYSNGMCCTITDPLTKEDASPSCQAMDESQCLSPEAQSWGKAEFIWGDDLKRVNKILCRN
jgi:hypothetical protein